MRYSKAQITSHWIGFGLVVVMAGSGLAYSYDLAGDGAMWVHQVAGQLLIVAVALRIANRIRTPLGQGNEKHTELQRRLAQITHLGLYLCLIAYLVTGYIAASADSNAPLMAPVSLAFARSDAGEMFLDAHYLLKWVLLALVSLHIAAALKHHFWDKDTTLTQMTYHARKG